MYESQKVKVKNVSNNRTLLEKNRLGGLASAPVLILTMTSQVILPAWLPEKKSIIPPEK